MNSTASDKTDSLSTTRLAIAGMTCGGCARHVDKTLGAVPGVEAVDVDLARACAIVRYDPSIATDGELASAVERAGYGVVSATTL